MYKNVFGQKVSRARYKEMVRAQKNRREIVAAQLPRRELIKMGLLTGSGYLVAKSGLSARAEAPFPVGQPASIQASCAFQPFTEPFTVPPIKQPVASLSPAPTAAPNTAAGEGRTIAHQAFTQFPPAKLYEVHQTPAIVSIHSQLPLQNLWGFDGVVPGPTYVARYGEPILVRNFNDLPSFNGGFGLNSTSTHLHNGHTPSESDGNPCDFFESGHWYDQHYPNVLAGVLSTHQAQGGDINEAMSTLWYHDHRVDHTSQNVYKGLYGMYMLFNHLDTGLETTGFRLPSFPEFDIRMDFTDKVLDEDCEIFFDLFNLDGIIGDTFLVNGKVQPFMNVLPRRYRFRWLDAGPSRFYQLFFTDLNNLNNSIPFWHIANDGNLLPRPIQVTSARLGVAERHDIIMDFRPFRGKTIYLENRLKQIDGRGPVPPPNDLTPAGQGNLLLQFRVAQGMVSDHSASPSTQTFYSLPNNTETPRIQRTFKFDRLNGQWSINGKFMTCEEIRFAVQKNSVEHWLLTNLSGDWEHPIHIHLEEHQILSRQRQPVTPVEVARKDVSRLVRNERVQLFFRFRDFTGKYPIHCHNTVHEDHLMMMNWEVAEVGDNRIVP
jgi:FtsP/CotA-like multicopper oxidase with cupredoxin domain